MAKRIRSLAPAAERDMAAVIAEPTRKVRLLCMNALPFPAIAGYKTLPRVAARCNPTGGFTLVSSGRSLPREVRSRVEFRRQSNSANRRDRIAGKPRRVNYFQLSSTMRPSFSTAAETGFTGIEPITITLIMS